MAKVFYSASAENDLLEAWLPAEGGCVVVGEQPQGRIEPTSQKRA